MYKYPLFDWIYLFYLFICCFTSRSTARFILQPVVYRWRKNGAYSTVNHRASASNYRLSNMKRPARDSNQWPRRLEVKTLTATPPRPQYLIGSTKMKIDAILMIETNCINKNTSCSIHINITVMRYALSKTPQLSVLPKTIG